MSNESIYTAPITPTEFEMLVQGYLIELGKNLTNLTVQHNKRLEASDGTYQIDVLATFEAFGAVFKVVVECKHYKSRVGREKVQVLYDRMRALGAHKGCLFSSSGFQEGAVKFAEVHGIALISVVEGKYMYRTRSSKPLDYEPPELPEWLGMPKFICTYRRHPYIYNLQPGHLEGLVEYIKQVDA